MKTGLRRVLRETRWAWSVYVGWLAAASCVLVSPIEEARRDDLVRDAGTAKPKETSGQPTACRRTAMDRCDAEACGCTPRQLCTWDTEAAAGTCQDMPSGPQAPQAPRAAEGERCLRTEDCNEPMVCSSFHVCATRCAPALTHCGSMPSSL